MKNTSPIRSLLMIYLFQESIHTAASKRARIIDSFYFTNYLSLKYANLIGRLNELLQFMIFQFCQFRGTS